MEIQITVIKFETIDGKKAGKSFAFKLDPKKMAIYKTEATLRKKIEEYVAMSGVFKSSELKELKYSMKDFLEEWKKQLPIVEAEELAKIEASPNHPESRITQIISLDLAPTKSSYSAPTNMGCTMEELQKWLMRCLVPSWVKATVCRGRAMLSTR